MEITGQYLNYTDYKGLGGNDLDQLPFNLLELEARKMIDNRTQNRLKGIDEIPQEVKLCIFKMVNMLNQYNRTRKSRINGVSSENTDGYSVQFLSSSESIKNINLELEDIMEEYLMGVVVNGAHIMYAGVL